MKKTIQSFQNIKNKYYEIFLIFLRAVLRLTIKQKAFRSIKKLITIKYVRFFRWLRWVCPFPTTHIMVVMTRVILSTYCLQSKSYRHVYVFMFRQKQPYLNQIICYIFSFRFNFCWEVVDNSFSLICIHAKTWNE